MERRACIPRIKLNFSRDIESIQSEKVQIRDKKMKSKLAAPGAPPKPAQSPGGGGGEKINVLRSPAAA